ncbi:glycine--tRNA ligase subunit beta [Caldibacillus lycopersici]|uniref:Glycine--tRNA ligase beta subunit n=1 Tax=Perspicuibacillus lycopersici TaxID=1325689 RepID=A0AAE3IV20_9BACI|nr:glycine--tRNA ligase subunit beta [Perspicuibacillus lycopersici]MCU9613909.1 glycine--tRNA ligase subunit beta [Perspicuibacillus lycopersici]
MNKSDLLLEIGLEEVPARFLTHAMNQLAEKVKQLLTEKNIEFGAVQSYSSPRRLAVLIEDVSEKQLDLHEEVKGPSKKVALDAEGNWSKAAIGFTRGQGKSVEDIYFKEINGVEYVHVEKFTKGQDTIAILSSLGELITSLTFPKNMRWANLDIRYIRPIRWIVALFGNEIINLEVATVKSGRASYGHRFLGERVEIPTAKEYKQLLLSQYVMADYKDRKAVILSQIHQLEKEQNWLIPIDEDLLEEVTNLVEYPTVLFGSFDEDYLQLPKEVLITTMKEHQRYFPVTDSNGNLLAYFVTVRNGDQNHLETVRKGNEKVLRARLQDAVFFYEEDKKLSIEKALNKLEHVVYHEEIGTYQDKLTRIQELSQYIVQKVGINGEEEKQTLRAAEICKFDLVTQMVDEFTELQGIMGEKYAKIAGEADLVALAINEHYMPRFSDGQLPESNAGAIVSIADKLDTLASFFALNLIPTGSQDPYSLRRQATGIVQILLQKGWNLDFTSLLKKGIAKTSGFSKRGEEEVLNDLLEFFKLRFKHLLNERQVRYDIIEAVLEAPITNVKSLITKADILQAKKEESGFKEDMEALSRVVNIASKAEKIVEINADLFENESERVLYNEFVKIENAASQSLNDEQYYAQLVALNKPITNYFDQTMIMVDDENIRNNRLSFMRKLADLILYFAHFQNIIVK